MPPIDFNPRTAMRQDAATLVKTPIPELKDDPRHRVEELQDQFAPHDTLDIGDAPFGSSDVGSLFDFGVPSGPPKGLIKFKGQDFVPYTKPGHTGPARHPEASDRPKPEEHKPSEEEWPEDKESGPAGEGYNSDDKDPKPESGRPADDGTGPVGPSSRDYMPADDGSGPTGPRSRDYMPADDGTGPVGPRSALSASRISAVNLAAVRSVNVLA